MIDFAALHTLDLIRVTNPNRVKRHLLGETFYVWAKGSAAAGAIYAARPESSQPSELFFAEEVELVPAAAMDWALTSGEEMPV